MAMTETVTVRTEDVRRILHAYNNYAALLLTKSEMALLSSDPQVREEALRRIGEVSEQIGAHTREARRRLLGEA